MTSTGLAAKDGNLQEGDIILKVHTHAPTHAQMIFRILQLYDPLFDNGFVPLYWPPCDPWRCAVVSDTKMLAAVALNPVSNKVGLHKSDFFVQNIPKKHNLMKIWKFWRLGQHFKLTVVLLDPFLNRFGFVSGCIIPAEHCPKHQTASLPFSYSRSWWHVHWGMHPVIQMWFIRPGHVPPLSVRSGQPSLPMCISESFATHNPVAGSPLFFFGPLLIDSDHCRLGTIWRCSDPV